MRVVNCAGGHFFDADTYATCPVCGAEMVTESTSDKDDISKGKKDPPKKKTRRDWLDRILGKDESEVSTRGQDQITPRIDEGNPMRDEPPILTPPQIPPINGTDSFWAIKQTDSESDKKEDEPVESDASNENESSETDEGLEKKEISQDVPANSLQAEIQKISASDDGRTMSYFSAVMEDVGSQRTEPTDPVVGWLVCVAGKHFGECFNIHAGMNPIGRSFSNAIVIDKDNTVSREKHAVIIYEPKKREFYVKPGESSGLAYVNGDYITETVKIAKLNTLELGNSKFVFMPLCGEDFGWEDYITKE